MKADNDSECNDDATSAVRETSFFALAKRFRDADDADEVQKRGDELGRFIFAS